MTQATSYIITMIMVISSFLFLLDLSEAFSVVSSPLLQQTTTKITSFDTKTKINFTPNHQQLLMSIDSKSNEGVVELVDDEDSSTTASVPVSSTTSPFLSQGEIEQEALQLSNDPKQTRVIIYIVLSLLPVLFLIPLMLGSRDLIPMDALPPVDL
mmetsp:Transcript_5956/g.7598  ORF Transcript_5956/g.7598 Transcript_5956/m.7598 type:complete len:155 (+) Transcript_5956:163-627(+)